MSIWKSPVFYFGVLLSLLVVSALAAPYVVPWNNYRGDLETYGRKLTGRDVTIDGDIAVKLFPWPQLQAKNVAIGNPEGFSETAFISADEARVRLSLGGLMNGAIDVQSIEIEKPEINLQRNATGSVNWIFVPQEQVVGSGLLSRVKLDKIVVTNATLKFDDLRNGHSTLLTEIGATLSAQSILGPWRSTGSAKWNDVSFGLNLVTGLKEQGQPLKFTVRLSPHDLALPQAALEGAWDGTNFKGFMRVDPQESKGEKQSAEGALKPLAMQAVVEASEQRLSLLKIKIRPFDQKDSGTLIEGDAIFEFSSQSVARLELKSPRINLDTLVGSTALRQWRDGGFLTVVNQLLLNTPAKMVADYKLNVSVLTSGGQALNDVRLTGSLQKEALRVHEFVAELPGRSVGAFDGIMFPGQGAAQLAGKLRFESADSRAFIGWLAPTWNEQLAKHWTGSRGRLVVQSGALDWSKDRIALNQVNFEFDGMLGTASLSSGFGAQPSTNLKLNLEQLDVDGLIPNGWSFIRDGGASALVSSMASNDQQKNGTTQIELKAKNLLLNGVSAQDVLLDFATQNNGFNIQQFSIGNVGGAKLQGGGALLDKGDGPEGVVKFKLQAEDPRGFLRLTGLEYGQANWTQALGKTEFDATLTAVPQKNGPELEIIARGASGAINAELVATLRELNQGANIAIAASGGLNSADSSNFAKLMGLATIGPVGPGDLVFEFNGSIADGFTVSTRLKALDATAEFSGTAHLQKPFFSPSGKISIVAADGRSVVQAIGLPLPSVIGQPLNVSGLLGANETELSFIDVAGNITGQRFSGEAKLKADKSVEVDLETDTISLRDVWALAFMPWEGPLSDYGDSFADLESSMRGEVFLRPLQFETATAAAQSETVVGFGFGPEERRLTITNPGEQGLKAEIVLKPRGNSYDIEGSGRWPIDLAQHLKSTNGDVLLRGELQMHGAFKSTGRSPAAALAAMDGKGSFSLSNAAISQLTIQDFAKAVTTATTPEQLSKALNLLNSSPGTTIGLTNGNFSIVTGELLVTPISIPAEGAVLNLSPKMDLTSGNIKIATTVQLTNQENLPSVTVTYDGPAGAMEMRNGTSALAAKLGYEILSKEMAALEKLQQEQQALIAKEEAQRRADEQRFADYQNTRAELRQQIRLRRFHNAKRVEQQKILEAIETAAIKSSATSAKLDMQRHARRLAVRRAALQ